MQKKITYYLRQNCPSKCWINNIKNTTNPLIRIGYYLKCVLQKCLCWNSSSINSEFDLTWKQRHCQSCHTGVDVLVVQHGWYLVKWKVEHKYTQTIMLYKHEDKIEVLYLQVKINQTTKKGPPEVKNEAWSGSCLGLSETRAFLLQWPQTSSTFLSW